MSTYLKNAVDCPAPQYSAVMVDPNGATVATPTIAMGVDYGSSGPLVVATDHNATLQDMQARFGSPGGYGVLFGCALSLSGSNVVVAGGAVDIDGYQPIIPGSYALTDGVNVQNWIWAKKGRSSPVAVVTGSLLPPLGGAALLGMVVMNGGVAATPDLSGVVYRKLGGWWWRKTADSGMPGDTPSANLLLTNHSKGDNTFWLWTGEAYIQQPSPAVDVTAFIRKDGTVPFTGDQDLGAHKLTGLANGSSAQDAATIAQLNALAVGGLVYNTQTGTSYSALAVDKGKVLRFTNAGAIAVLVDTSLFSVGEMFNIRQVGAGQVTVSVAGGQTILAADGKVSTRVQGSEITCSIDAATVLHIGGDAG